MRTFSILLCLLFALFSSPSHAQKNTTYFTQNPTISPNADYIIFSYEGDLWRVDVSGGEAYRITSMAGDETNPSISPDGEWLAFSSNQYGNSDVYLMSLKGGNIQQLTFHESADIVTSWSWDSSTIYFVSSRLNALSTYTVSRTGSTPKLIFDHFFNTIHNVVEHPSSGELFFNETWESGRFAHRKRYKGDYNPDIKSYNSTTKEFKKYTNYRGKDFATTIDSQGTIYFKSDEANGEYNLYTLENGNKKQLTDFSTSIMWPKVSANGSKVVFRKDYQIQVYDVATGKTTTPSITMNRVNTLNKMQSFNVTGKITAFDVSPDQKKLAFISRGRLFISDVKGKFVSEIKTDHTEAVQEVFWLKDNKSLLFTQSLNGYYNWYSIDAASGNNLKQLTKNNSNNRQLTFNSDRSKAVYLRGRNEICLMDMTTMKSTVIINDELWGFNNSNPYFSPDDKYILYNAKRDFENDVFVYNLTTKQVQNLTNTKVNEVSPVWSPDGKYIYFASDRTQPSYPYGTRNAKIYQMSLDKFEAPFKSAQVAKLFEAKENGKDAKDSKDEKAKEVKKPTVRINSQDLMERLVSISPSFGQQSNPTVIKSDKKIYVLYTSNHAEGKSQLWKTTIEPFEKNKTELVDKKTMRGYQIITAGKTNYMLSSGTLHTVDLSSNKLKTIKIDFTFEKSLNEEFNQMFDEAWAGMEENFYNETFHGQDWAGLKKKYKSFLPFITNRAHLRLIFNEMLGELNTSHFGFNSRGNEEKLYHGTLSLSSGILFDNDNPFVIDRIVKQSPADITGKSIRKGDLLKAVNGVKVDTKTNREQYFNSVRPKELTLTLERNGTAFEIKIHPVSSGAIRNLLYDEWQDANQNYVDTKTNNRIAYVHMKNMGGGELTKFKEDLVSGEAYKDGLILDLRYNTGGNVHDDVLRFLSQRTYLNWKYREGKLTGQSNFGYSDKPIILLINEQSLSDAEMTAAGFKALNLGTIVGTETYRWIIFTSGKSLVDGSFYRLPSWGCYTLDGKNLESEGVSPDVYIGKDFKDRLDGNHPQLDKAIQLIMEDLNK